MGFIWTINPSPSDKILVADIQEVRKNADWIKDNLACFVHDSSFDGTHNPAVLAANKATHKSANNTSEDVSHNTGYQAVHNSQDDAVQKVSEDASHDGTNLVNHKGAYQVAYNSGVQNSVETGYCSTDHASHLVDYFSGDNSSFNTTYNGALNSAEDVG
jgi:hypothetical protein